MPVTAPIEKKAVQGSDGEPRRVLFVCTGNTCRSPMAAALYNDMQRPREFCTACEECAAEESLTPTNAVALSAGLYVSEGAPISEEAVTVLREARVMPVPGNDYPAHLHVLVHMGDEGVYVMVPPESEVAVGHPIHRVQRHWRYPAACGDLLVLLDNRSF